MKPGGVDARKVAAIANRPPPAQVFVLKERQLETGGTRLLRILYGLFKRPDGSQYYREIETVSEAQLEEMNKRLAHHAEL